MELQIFSFYFYPVPGVHNNTTVAGTTCRENTHVYTYKIDFTVRRDPTERSTPPFNWGPASLSVVNRISPFSHSPSNNHQPTNTTVNDHLSLLFGHRKHTWNHNLCRYSHAF